jgi:branched-chain amino acid transport system ATP-binding protein
MTGVVLPVLDVDGVSKRFGGLVAVRDISFTVTRGEIVGLVGPNGAGKSVMINLVCGVYAVSGGEIRLGGATVTHTPAYMRSRSGVGRTYQNIRLLRRMTVLENVLVADKEVAAKPFLRGLFGSSRPEVTQAVEMLERMHLSHKLNQSAAGLAYGEARRLEIARALMGRPRLLFLDEPAAGMNEQEMEELSLAIALCRQTVEAIVLVEHDMAFIQRLADRLIVMDAGIKIAEGDPEEVFLNPRVVEAYLGVDDDGT